MMTSGRALILTAGFSLTLLVSATAMAASRTEVAGAATPSEDTGLIQGNRVVTGVVEEIKGGQAKVNTGDLHPRFIPLKPGRDKHQAELQPGDRVELTLNDQNLVVDYHHAGEPGGHQILRGRLAQALTVGQDRAVIKTESGAEEIFDVRPPVRSKLGAIPVGAEVVVLIDEGRQIADVTFPGKDTAKSAAHEGLKSPIKGPHQRVEGTILTPVAENRVTIRTEDGKEQQYEVRPPVQDKLARVARGESVTLLIDDDNKVIDVAVPAKRKG